MCRYPTALIAWIAVINGASLAICWSILFWAMGKGYDITDDAHYLIWGSNPFIYPWSVSEFGIVWHPIYKLVGGDIKSFRLAGAATLSLSAAIFGWSVWRLVAPRLPTTCALPLILSITISGLWTFVFWLPTPSYNELNLCGLLLFSAGFAFATPTTGFFSPRVTEIETVAKGVLTGFGMCLVALAKPTTVIGAGLIGLVWLATFRPQRALVFLFSATASAAISLAAVVAILDGNMQKFVQRKLTGIHMLSVHSPTHDPDAMWRGLADPLVDLLTSSNARLPLLIVIGIWFCWSTIALWASNRAAWFVNFLSVATAVAMAITVARWRTSGSLTDAYDVALIAPMLLLIAIALTLVVRPTFLGDRRLLAFSAIVASLPIIFSIGSGVPVIYHASQAAAFWFTPSIILSVATPPEVRLRVLFGTTTFSSLLTIGILAGAIADPYRLSEPLWMQTERVEIGATSAPLQVDKATASYITALKNAAAAHGFRPGTPIIDLTGNSPGTVFALGGEAPGIPWLSGGYAGSVPYVVETLNRVPHDKLRGAWVLTTSGTKVALPDEIMRSLALDFPERYQIVGRACLGIPCNEQILWKPAID
jgi:hypothetical protein